MSSATNPDLRAFRERGGRLIVHQGWSDPSTATLATVDYYETLMRVIGSRERTQEFARLYLLPGVGHCGGGRGAGMVDFLSALERWVERGEAPEQLVGYHITGEVDPGAPRFPIDPAQVDFTRAYYPYPAIAKFSGKGEANDYRSWVKAMPGKK
ncbi:MAG: tannase/feruloyl esterase family alpha/beta hydrolase [Gammaproteobacteria bacterium]|nr:tannase/feruloyl esterase family alpha/beta hydrolase [Gammaproteobacteria bacterium]